jgi:hypothetical protein
MSPDDLDTLEETLDILSNPEALELIRSSTRCTLSHLVLRST